MWTENFQIYKLDLEKAEEPEIKLHWIKKKQGIPEKHLLHWLSENLWLYGSQQTVEKSQRDGNTRPPYPYPKKPICRSRSNSYNWTCNNKLVPNQERVCQGCILSPWLFNLYKEYIMQNARINEAQAGIKIARRNINNFRYVDDTTLMQKVNRN